MATPTWLRYANQNATRNQPLSPRLVEAFSFLPDLGVTMEVFSGGQPSSGSNRVGSHRHDHGNAADVFFYRDGRRLDWSNPGDREVLGHIVAMGKQRGVTGFGAGQGYMQPGSLHVGFGPEAVWGAGGRAANAPEWLRQAYYQPQSLPPLPIPTGGSALDAANAMAGAPEPPQRPAGLAYVPPPPPPLPRTDPRLPSAQIDALAGAVPAAVLPRLNDADINERAIDTYGPDAQATSPTQDLWNEYSNWMEQSTPGTPSTRVARGAPQTVPFPWNDQMGQSAAVANALGGPPIPPQRPGALPPPMPPVRPISAPTDVAQAPIPPVRPSALPTAPMATFAGETVGGNPVEQARSFLGDFASNGGLLGMGLNLVTGRGLFPGDQGVIPQFKQGVLDRMEELGPKRGDVLSGIFSRRVGETPTFSRSVPQSGPFSVATAVGPGGSESGFLSGRSFQPRGSTYDANVRRANMDALRGVEGRTMREKIDNFQRSGGTLYKAG